MPTCAKFALLVNMHRLVHPQLVSIARAVSEQCRRKVDHKFDLIRILVMSTRHVQLDVGSQHVHAVSRG